MAVTRRTISLPDRLARDIELIARKEKRSFSAAIAELAREALRRRRAPVPRFIGAAESGLPDLGENAERYLDEIWRELANESRRGHRPSRKRR